MSTLAQPNLPVRPSLRMSEEEYTRRYADNHFSEWIDGEVIFKMPAHDKQDELQRWLGTVVDAFVGRRKLGRVRGPNFTMRLPLKPSRRDPDLMIIFNDRVPKLRPTYLEGPADVVFEIVSPDSEVRDYHQKYAEYENGGVPEYWILNPDSQTARLLVRGPESTFIQLDEREGKLFSTMVPGFWLRPSDLWLSPLPDAIEFVSQLLADGVTT